MNRLIHVSFDEIDEFVPRIPKHRCPGEDDTIPRICVASTVKKCLLSMPGAGSAVKNLVDLDIPAVIHAYILTPYYGSVRYNTIVCKYVPDARYTGEMWLVKPPAYVERRDYEILEPEFITSLEGLIGIKSCKLKRVKNQNNWEIFWNKFRAGEPMPPQFLISDFSYRTLAQNLDSIIDMINERSSE